MRRALGTNGSGMYFVRRARPKASGSTVMGSNGTVRARTACAAVSLPSRRGLRRLEQVPGKWGALDDGSGGSSTEHLIEVTGVQAVGGSDRPDVAFGQELARCDVLDDEQRTPEAPTLRLLVGRPEAGQI